MLLFKDSCRATPRVISYCLPRLVESPKSPHAGHTVTRLLGGAGGVAGNEDKPGDLVRAGGAPFLLRRLRGGGRGVRFPARGAFPPLGLDRILRRGRRGRLLGGLALASLVFLRLRRPRLPGIPAAPRDPADRRGFRPRLLADP